MSINNPILLDLPMPIRTKHLAIRPLMPGNGKLLFEAIEETREQLTLWLGWVKDVKIWQDSEITARKFYAEFIRRNALHLAVFKEDWFIGMVGFHDINWKIPSAAIGYWCRQTAQGQGYIREAGAAITRYAFDIMGMKRLTITCQDDNAKSIRVAESLGFSLEIRAKGLTVNAQDEELVMGRCYVRFNVEGV